MEIKSQSLILLKDLYEKQIKLIEKQHAKHNLGNKYYP